MSSLLIAGAGGHGKVVADAAISVGLWDEIAFLDDREDVKQVLGVHIAGKFADAANLRQKFTHAAAAIGDNASRRALQERLEALGFELAVIVHPAATISVHAKLGPGTVAMAGAVVNACARTGRGCILNTGCTVDHDCVLGDFAHISPGAHIAGQSLVGDESWVCIGAIVSHGVRIGSRTVIAAGAALVADADSRALYAGVPAIKKKVYA